MTDTLYFYRCRNDDQMLATVAKSAGKVWRCVVCRSPMRFLWEQPVETARERRWFEYGIVYNPGIATCARCGVKLTTDPRRTDPHPRLYCASCIAAEGLKEPL